MQYGKWTLIFIRNMGVPFLTNCAWTVTKALSIYFTAGIAGQFVKWKTTSTYLTIYNCLTHDHQADIYSNELKSCHGLLCPLFWCFSASEGGKILWLGILFGNRARAKDSVINVTINSKTNHKSILTIRLMVLSSSYVVEAENFSIPDYSIKSWPRELFYFSNFSSIFI